MIWLFDRDLLVFRSELVRRKYDSLLKRELPFPAGAAVASDSKGGERTDALTEEEELWLERALEDIAREKKDVFRHGFEFGTQIPKTVYKVYKKNGQLEYWEIRSSYLREKQQEWASEVVSLDGFVEHPMHVVLFEKMLDIARENDIKLIVNEYWDAPYQYDVAWNRELYEKYLGKIQGIVESKGFTYISVDFSSFSNLDYYDYDHMNAQGARKYSRLLAEKLAEVFR